MRTATALSALALMLVITACTSPDEVRGVVLDVTGTLTSVESFVIRTDGGETLTVTPDPNGNFAFPLPHLNDHRSTLSPIIVELDRETDPPTALSIRDADDAAWHE